MYKTKSISGCHHILLAIVAVGCMIMFASEMFLHMDASSSLYGILKYHYPMIPWHRYSVLLFQIPVLAGLRMEMPTNTLVYLYGTPYCLAPFISSLLILVLSRKYILNPTVPLMGILLFPLFIMPHIFTEHLLSIFFFWPLSCLLTLPQKNTVLENLFSYLLLLILFFIHPISALMFAVLAAFTYAQWIQYRLSKTLHLSLFLLMLSMIRLIITPNLTDKGLPIENSIRDSISIFLSNPNLFMFTITSWVLIALFFLKKTSFQFISAIYLMLVMSLVVIIGSLLRNQTILDGFAMRQLVFPLQIPLFALYCHQNLRPQSHQISNHQKNIIIFIIASSFTILISTTAWQRYHLLTDTTTYIEAQPKICIEITSLPPEYRNYMSAHWSFPYEFLFFKRHEPIQRIVTSVLGGCSRYRQNDFYALSPYENMHSNKRSPFSVEKLIDQLKLLPRKN